MMKQFAVLGVLSFLLFSASSKPAPETASMPQYLKEYNAGLRAQDERNYETAIDHFEKSLKKKSDFSNAWNQIGYCNRMIAKAYLEKSGRAYTKAINFSPKNQLALEYQGEYFLMMGQIKSAYNNYQKLEQMGAQGAADLKEDLDETLRQAQYVLKRYQP